MNLAQTIVDVLVIVESKAYDEGFDEGFSSKENFDADRIEELEVMLEEAEDEARLWESRAKAMGYVADAEEVDSTDWE